MDEKKRNEGRDRKRTCEVELDLPADVVRKMDDEAESLGLDRGDFVMRAAEGKPVATKNDVVYLMAWIVNYVNVLNGILRNPGWTDAEREIIKSEVERGKNFYLRLAKFGTELGHRSHSSANRERKYLNTAGGRKLARCVIRLTPKEKEILDKKVKKSGIGRRDFIVCAVRDRTETEADIDITETPDYLRELIRWLLLRDSRAPFTEKRKEEILKIIPKWRLPREPLASLIGGPD